MRRTARFATALVFGIAAHPGTFNLPDRFDGGIIERVSVASDGTEANDDTNQPAISDDGRFVAFDSQATTLVVRDTNGERDIFLYDRKNDTIERVSIASDGEQADNDSEDASVSADGRFIAFESKAANLVAGDTNNARDIFVVDRTNDTIERVSVASDGAEGDDDSGNPVISDDGRFVAFESEASNLVPGDTTGGFLERDVFVHDRTNDTTERVSVASDGTEGNDESQRAAISDDGRFVAFDSGASTLVPSDTNFDNDIFVHDRDTGTTERISIAQDGTQGDGDSNRPDLSADARFAAFNSRATQLVSGDTNGFRDIFVRRVPSLEFYIADRRHTDRRFLVSRE